MELSRRDCLRWSAAGVGGALLAGCAPLAAHMPHGDDPLPLPDGDVHPTVRLLNRAGFGPCPGDVARTSQMGHEAYIARELKPSQREDLSLLMQLQRLDVLQVDDVDMTQLPRAEVIRQLQQATILRSVYGRNQLQERMVDFWSNHFNVYALKGDSAFRIGTAERNVIRNNALGKFPDILRASSRSPAMLAYLDNPENFQAHPNENYARELMELHTLGLGGGYTQKDVQEVARCFTGWGIENRFLRPRGNIRFIPELHDDGPKLVLGHVIPAGGGENDVEQVLAILSAHPSTAHFISRKLVRFFYGDEEPKLVETMAKAYMATDGDVPSMIGPLLTSPKLAEGPPILKRPFELIASAIRASKAETDGSNGIQQHLQAMGEPLYQWPMPDGYPTKTSAWTGSMLPRWNFVHALAHGDIRGTTAPTCVADPFEQVHSRRTGDEDRDLVAAMAGKAEPEAFALAMASPAFQWT